MFKFVGAVIVLGGLAIGVGYSMGWISGDVKVANVRVTEDGQKAYNKGLNVVQDSLENIKTAVE